MRSSEQLTLPTFPAPMTEEQIRRFELREHQRKRAVDLEEYRVYLRRFYYANESMPELAVPNVAWADVVRRKFGIEPCKGPHRANNFLGALFKDGKWGRVGRVRSKTRGGHGNDIILWTMLESMVRVKEFIEINKPKGVLPF